MNNFPWAYIIGFVCHKYIPKKGHEYPCFIWVKYQLSDLLNLEFYSKCCSNKTNTNTYTNTFFLLWQLSRKNTITRIREIQCVKWRAYIILFLCEYIFRQTLPTQSHIWTLFYSMQCLFIYLFILLFIYLFYSVLI